MILIYLLLNLAVAGDRRADIFELGKLGGKPEFVQTTHTEQAPSGEITSSTVIVDSKGKPALSETAVFLGPKLIRQRVDQLQVGVSYQVESPGKSAVFKEFTIKDGQLILKTTEEEKIGDDFLTGPVTEPYLQSQWAALMKGDTIHVRFGVLELAETVGFKFWQRESTTLEGKPVVVLRMKPSSIFISALVDPIDLFFDPIRKMMLRFRGRTPLKKQVDGKWKPFDGDIYYR